MSGFTVQKGRFCERRMFRKKQRQFRVKSITLVSVRDVLRYRGQTLISHCVLKQIVIGSLV